MSLTLISESGLHSPEDILMLRKHGYKGFLIGEAFMRSAHPGRELARFVQELRATK